jgi:hypothetical protein
LTFHFGKKSQIIRPKIFYRIWVKIVRKYIGKEFVVSLLSLGGYVAVPQLADLKEI